MGKHALAAVLAALALAGCEQKGVRQPCPAALACLEFGNAFDPTSLDPQLVTSSWESQLVTDFLVGLTQYDAAGNTVPGMAKTWEVTPDGRLWTFHLRDALWSDGKPVTADDFVFALRRLLDPKTAAPYASLVYAIVNAEAVNSGKAPVTALGVRALDAKTLQISLNHAAPYLLQLASHQTMLPLPRHAVERFGDKWSEPENYVSNGPFTPKSWRLQDKIIALKNPRFYEADQVCLDRVTYYPTSDYISAERQVERGEIDTHAPIQPSRVAYLRQPGHMPQYVRSHLYLGVYYLAVNTKLKKFADPRVRQALSMAIDREFITEGVSKGTGYKPAYTFVPPGVANYAPPPPPAWAKLSLIERQALARKLLAEAGFGPKNPLAFEVTTGLIDGSQYIESMQQDWAAIGVKATQVTLDGQVAYQAYRLRDFEIGSASWLADFNDPINFLYLMKSDTGAINYADYSDPAYDALLSEADNEGDPVKRQALLQKAEMRMNDSAPVIPYYFSSGNSLVSPRVTGWVDNIVNNHPARYLCFKDVKR